MTIKIFISNGNNRFHLARIPPFLLAKQIPFALQTSFWPNRFTRFLGNLFPGFPVLERLNSRDTGIQESFVINVYLSELICFVARVLRLYRISILDNLVVEFNTAIHSGRSIRVIRRYKPAVFHYRSSYGCNALLETYSPEPVLLCDHSTAHPLLIDFLVRSGGVFPGQDQIENCSKNLSSLCRKMLSDINLADHIVVNSDFVKDTFLVAGHSRDNVSVIHLGIDNVFLNYIRSFASSSSDWQVRLLYAGAWIKAKGVGALLDAVNSVACSVDIAGSSPDDIIRVTPGVNFDLVRSLGYLSRRSLALAMMRSSIFVFPSFCEGSARVVFEAMACGCYIITTPNSGSIVEDGVHGAVVSPGDSVELASAIEYAITNPRLVADIGLRNRDLVFAKYTQEKYGQAILDLYGSLADHRFCG